MKPAFIIFALIAFVPHGVAATTSPVLNNARLNLQEASTPDSQFKGGFFNRFLGARNPLRRPEVGTTFTVTSSAYAPSPYQTDNTPCITASGTKVRRGTVASNFLPMGTILEIEGQPYIVEDRMNARYSKSIDIFYLHTDQALEFGRQKLTVTILGYGTPGQSLVAYKAPAGEKPPIQQDPPGFVAKITGRLAYLQKSFSYYIGIRRPLDVNRYDVDCLNA